MSETKSIGIVGQTYEDRRTGRIGTIESSDDKYRTILMVSPIDGNTFNITYASFKSNWRKYASELPTLNEVEPQDEKLAKSLNITPEDLNMTPTIIKPKKEKLEKVKKERYTSSKGLEDLHNSVVEYLKEFGDEFSIIDIPKHSGLSIKYNKHRIIDIFVLVSTNRYYVRMHEDDYSKIILSSSLNVKPSSVEFHEGKVRPIRFYVKIESLSTLLKDITPILLSRRESKVKEEN